MSPKIRISILLISLPLLLTAHCASSQDRSAASTYQGWDLGKQIAWYTATQGSRLIPKAWLDALEQPDAVQPTPFLDPNYIQSFRYLPSQVTGWTSPDPSCPFDPALPLGFTLDCQSDRAFKVTGLRWKASQSDREPWVGLNCSACHTAEITYKGTHIRVDGGPTLADFQSFTEKLDLALEQTATDPAKLTRFAKGVLGANPAPGDLDLLHAALISRISWNKSLARLNATPGYRYGFGRLDAIGHIYDKVALVAMPNDGGEQTANPADAPVSYPFLWNVPQLDRVEWNGIAPNEFVGSVPGHEFNYGGLGRNTGEVIGVFADIIITSRPGLGGYVSSVDQRSLADMETQLGFLRPPSWPTVFPPVNRDVAAAGRELFVRARCSDCHAVPAIPANLTERYKTTLSRAFSNDPKDRAVDTDIWMACNAVFDQAKTGLFESNRVTFFGNEIFGPKRDNFSLVQNAVTGTLLGQKLTLLADAVDDLFGFGHGLPEPSRVAASLSTLSAKEQRRARCLSFGDTIPPKVVYKARPLQGIWATAPYLHNGSVPTLFDLLLPPAQRPSSFYTGTREFDPEKVGYETQPAAAGNSFKFQTQDASGKPRDGDSNAGHDYGNRNLSDADRRALIEYMKTL